MTYATGEAAAMTLIQTLSVYTTKNSISTANDTENKSHGFIEQGEAQGYCLLQPGGLLSAVENINGTETELRWITHIDIIEMLDSIETTTSPEKRLADNRDAIIDVLDSYYNLNSEATVSFAKVMRAEPPTDFGLVEADGPVFTMQRLELEWHEIRAVAQND